MAIDYTKRPSSGGDDARASGAGSPAPVSLSKVTLTKSAPVVSLSKQQQGSGVLRVNLNWNARPGGGGGFFKKSAPSIDLDLGCLYEYADGSKGVVQALGNAFRGQHTLGPDPIVWLDGDDRSGTVSGGENLLVDLRQLASVRRIVVFAFIYQGVPNWAAADGVVTLFPAAGGEIVVPLDEPGPGAGMCAVALLENAGGDLSVRREVRYVSGHAELDQAYGWGLQWTRGRK